jgi:predicted ester cyclase
MGEKENHKRLIQRLTTAWNDRDRETMLELYADEFVIEGDVPEVRTKEEQVAAEWAVFEAFPDIEATTEELLAEGDSILVCWELSGTHQSEFAGIEPTGLDVEYTEWAIYRVEDGRLASVRAQTDEFALANQLGAVEWPPE